MTNQQAVELPQPGVGSFHDPPSLVTSQLASIFVPSFPVVAAVRCDQVDASLSQPLAQAVGVVPFVGDHALGLLPRTALRAWHADFRERTFRKSNFCRRGTFQPNSQRNTFAVCQYHPLRSLAALGFTDCEAPLFAGAKLPSRKVSSQRSSPSSSNPPSNARQALSQPPSSCHFCNRRQQVEGEGNSFGKNRHAAPVCRIHRIPSKQVRFGAGGRPLPSARGLGFGNSGSISSHCSSVSSFCRRFIAEAQPLTHLTRKYLARG